MGGCVCCFVPCWIVVLQLYPTTIIAAYRSSGLVAIVVAESIQVCLTLQLYHKVCPSMVWFLVNNTFL